MDNRYTVIYVESWLAGSHRQHSTKFLRFTLRPGEVMIDALDRLEIDNAVLIFQGWPLLEGEREIDLPTGEEA